MQHDFILLDRTGSMDGLWQEALNSVNAYVKKLADDKIDTGVTLVTFDKPHNSMAFEIIRDRIIPSTWKAVTNDDATPRGMTPLNDAIARIVSLAHQGINGIPYEKVALIIMTDGHENSSIEYRDPNVVKKMLDDCRAKGWQVIFLGANFDNAAQAASYGNSANQTISSSAANLSQTMGVAASMRSAYASYGTAMTFTDEEKEQAAQQ